jgi:hypothetical protein
LREEKPEIACRGLVIAVPTPYLRRSGNKNVIGAF